MSLPLYASPMGCGEVTHVVGHACATGVHIAAATATAAAASRMRRVDISEVIDKTEPLGAPEHRAHGTQKLTWHSGVREYTIWGAAPNRPLHRGCCGSGEPMAHSDEGGSSRLRRRTAATLTHDANLELEPSLMQVASPAKLSGGLAVVGSTVALGYVVTTSHGPELLLALAVAAGFIALALWNRAVTVAVLLLAILNGFPLVDFESFVAPGSFRPNDLFVMILVACLGLWSIRNPVRPIPRYVVLARWWAAAFLTWWLVTLLRSSPSVPLLHASLFGRDFLYFGLLVPALLGVGWRREELLLMARVLGAATVIFAVGAIVTSLGVADLTFITHPNLTASFEGLTRLYAPMNDLVVLGFAAGIGLALLAPEVRLQRLGWGLALLMGIEFALQLTRAAYLAALVAVVATIGLWLYQRDAVSLRMRPRVLALVLSLVLLVGAFTFVGGGANGGAIGAVVNRATSSLSDVQSRGENVRYRLDVAARMKTVLGNEWPIGLGFLHPSYRYIPDLPDGSIRNSDLGVSNSLMTMGMIGTILLYLPLVYAIVALQRARTRRRSAPSDGWLVYGIAAWLLIAVAASATLSTLFTVNGLVLTGFVVSLGLRLTVWGGESPARS
jgi:hypothetical protein